MLIACPVYNYHSSECLQTEKTTRRKRRGGGGKWDSIRLFLNSVCCPQEVQLSAYNYLFKHKKAILALLFLWRPSHSYQVTSTESVHTFLLSFVDKSFFYKIKFLLLFPKVFINPLFSSVHRARKRYYNITKVGENHLGQNSRQTLLFVLPTKSFSLLPLPGQNKWLSYSAPVLLSAGFMPFVLLDLFLPLPSCSLFSPPLHYSFSFAFLSLTFLFSSLSCC